MNPNNFLNTNRIANLIALLERYELIINDYRSDLSKNRQDVNSLSLIRKKLKDINNFLVIQLKENPEICQYHTYKNLILAMGKCQRALFRKMLKLSEGARGIVRKESLKFNMDHSILMEGINMSLNVQKKIKNWRLADEFIPDDENDNDEVGYLVDNFYKDILTIINVKVLTKFPKSQLTLLDDLINYLHEETENLTATFNLHLKNHERELSLPNLNKYLAELNLLRKITLAVSQNFSISDENSVLEKLTNQQQLLSDKLLSIKDLKAINQQKISVFLSIIQSRYKMLQIPLSFTRKSKINEIIDITESLIEVRENFSENYLNSFKKELQELEKRIWILAVELKTDLIQLATETHVDTINWKKKLNWVLSNIAREDDRMIICSP